MADKIRVAAYCRVSTEKDEQLNSLKTQKEYFTQYIINHDGWILENVYADEGVSGTSTKRRTEFNRMIMDAKNKKIDLILTKEVSRFARNTVDTLYWTRELKYNGVGVIFINDNINTMDSEGEFRLTIMASVAQEESRKTSERVKWGQRRRMEQGVVFGRDLLGYFVRDGKLIINPDEVETVRLIYHKFLNESKGTYVIARELYESGIYAKRVKEWNNIVILRVLRSEKYVGDLLQKKTYTPDYLTHQKKYNKNRDDMVYIKDNHEPIIDRETWDAVQAELKRRSPDDDRKSRHSNRYWCSGKIKCGECEASFVSRTKKKNEYKAWRCYSGSRHGTEKEDSQGNMVGCNNFAVNEKVLLFCVGYVIDYIMDNKDEIINELMRDITEMKKRTAADIIDTSDYSNKIKAIEDKKMNIINLRAEGEINKKDFTAMNGRYDEEIKAIERQIKEAESKNSITQTQVDNLQLYVAEIENLLDIENSDGREAIYHEMLKKIVVYNDKILDIHLNCLPTPIKIKYSVKGRLDNYKVLVEDIGIV